MKLNIKQYFKAKYVVIAFVLLMCWSLYANLTVLGPESQTSAVTITFNWVPNIAMTYEGNPNDKVNIIGTPVLTSGGLNMQAPDFTGGLSSSFLVRLRLDVNTSTAAGGSSFVTSTLKVNSQTITMQSISDPTATFPLNVGLSNSNADTTGTSIVTLSNPTFIGYLGDPLTSYLIFSGSVNSVTAGKPNGLYLAQSGVTVTLEWN